VDVGYVLRETIIFGGGRVKQLLCVVCDKPLKGRQTMFCGPRCKSTNHYHTKLKTDPERMLQRRAYMRDYMSKYYKEKPEKYEIHKAKMRKRGDKK
jgi:predicted amidophosphoribosyltransferase